MEDHGDYVATLLLGQQAVFAQSLEHVFNVDDGIVDQRTDGNGNTAQTHRIDGMSQGLQGEQGDQNGKGNGDERNQGGARVHQEEE